MYKTSVCNYSQVVLGSNYSNIFYGIRLVLIYIRKYQSTSLISSMLMYFYLLIGFVQEHVVNI